MTRFFALILLLSSFQIASAQKAIPELWSGRVHDEANVLSSSAVERLESQLKTYEDSTTNQVAVLIVPSLDGDVLEEYSLRVAEKWKLGQKERDNGVLLLIAINDRKMRIEVGEGLEGVLTDALSNRIIRNEIAPEFRRGDYESGVLAGVNGIISAIGGEYTAADFDSEEMEELSGGALILIALFIYGILGVFTFIGLVSGKTGWFLYFFLIPFWAIFPAAILGGSFISLIIYLIGFPILKIFLSKTDWGKRMAKGMESSGRSSSSTGGFWSGGGGGWSSGGGGGFSGGGGGFSGGGSSGSW